MPASTTAEPSSSTIGSSPPSPSALESNLISHLTSTSALEDLHATLLASLQRAGWTERVRTLSVELLRAGRCDRFDDVVDTVVALAEGKSHAAASVSNGHSTNSNKKDSDDDADADADADGDGDADGDPDSDAIFENADVRIPRAVVDQGVKTIKEALREVVVIEDDGESTTDGDDNHNHKATVKKEGKEGTSGKAPKKNGTSSPVKKTVKEKKAKAGKGVRTGQ